MKVKFMWFVVKAALAMLVSFSALVAQTSGQRSGVDQLPLCGSNADVVRLNVSVLSSKNKTYLRELAHDDFEIRDGRQTTKIECFERQDAPVSIGILFDLSGSMLGDIEKRSNAIPFGIQGITSFIDSGNPKNEYSILGFSTRAMVFLEPTRDQTKIRAGLKELAIVEPKGYSSIFEALSAGLDQVANRKVGRKVLLLVTDGLDNQSKESSYEKILNRVRKRDDLLIYMVNTEGSGAKQAFIPGNSQDKLETIVENTGGRVAYPKTRNDLNAEFNSIAEEIRSQYVLGFRTRHPPKQLWRKVKVKVKPEVGSVVIRATQGYFQ